MYVDVAATAVRRRAASERDSGKLVLRGEVVEWRAADPRDGPPLGKGEWSFDYEWYFEVSPLAGEEGRRDEESRQRAALANLRRLLREYGFAATLERPEGGNRPGGFLRAVGGVEELREIERLVSRFERELRASVSLGEAALEEGEGTVLRCYQAQFLELETIRVAVADLVEGVALLGLAHGHTERGKRFAAVKLAGEPEQILECMRRMHGLTLRQGDRTLTRLRWSPLPQDASPVGVALAKARLQAGERVALGFGQGAASMFPVAEWAWRSAASLLRGEEGGEGASAEVELAGMAAAAGWAQWQGTPATPLTQHTPAASVVGAGGRGGGREGGGRGGGRGSGGLPRVPESPEAAMVPRQLFGEQLAGMSGGEIVRLEELVAAARAGKAAAEELPGLRETVERQTVAQEELRERQATQAEALAALQEERQGMKELLEANQRALEGQIRAAQAASQPMLRAIMAKMGIALETEEGGRDQQSAMEVEEGGAGSAGSGGRRGAAPVVSEQEPAAAARTTGQSGQLAVERGGELDVREVEGGGAGEAGVGNSRAVVADSGGRREESVLGGLDHMLASQRRAELMVAKCRARLAKLEEAERAAEEAEGQALEAEEEAREAVEGRVRDDGEGAELDAALYSAMEESARASEALDVATTRRKAAEGALERAVEEHGRAGEDTRAVADKRKRREMARDGGTRDSRGREGSEEA